MKPKNLYITRGNLAILQEEYEDLGFETRLNGRVLAVFTTRRKPELTLIKLRKAREKAGK